MRMGCCAAKTSPINEPQEQDTPIRIRVRLRGDIKQATSDKIAQKICEVTSENLSRFKVENTEKDDFYFVTVNLLDGDPPGCSRKLSKQIINEIVGKGIPLAEDLKIFGAKEHLLAMEL